MKWMIALAALLVLVIGGFIGYTIYEEAQATRWERQSHQARMNDLAEDRAALALEREQRQSELAAQTAPLTHGTGVALGIGLAALLLVGGGAGLVIALQAAHRRSKVVRPDSRGLVPLPYDDQVLASVGAAALGAYHTAHIEAAKIGPVPHTVNYHPSVDIDGQATPVLPADTATTTTEADVPALPGPIDLAQIAFQPTLHSLLLGLRRDGSQIVVPADRLMHVALSGSTDSGKSNTGRLVLAQFLACGIDCAIADPKYTPYDAVTGEDWRPIQQRLAYAPAIKPDDIGILLDWLALEELERRLELRRQSQRYGAPFVLYLDELPSIVEHVEHATDRIAEILRMGRAVGLFIVGASQDFLIKTIGGSSGARECYKTAVYGGGDLIGARALLDMRQKDIEQHEGDLGKGVVLLRCASQPQTALSRVPLASNESLYNLLPDNAPTMERLTPAPTRDEVPGAARGAEGGTDGSEQTGAEPAGTDLVPDVDLIRQLLTRNPKLSSNELVKIIGGRRGAVLQIVKRIRAEMSQE